MVSAVTTHSIRLCIVVCTYSICIVFILLHYQRFYVPWDHIKTISDKYLAIYSQVLLSSLGACGL